MENELLQTCKDWDHAIELNDVERMAEYMADDWVLIGTEGGITDRSKFFDAIESGNLVHSRMDFDNLRVKIYGDCAIVVGLGTSSGKWRGKPFSYYEWTASTFIRHNGKWVCELTMLTPANEE